MRNGQDGAKEREEVFAWEMPSARVVEYKTPILHCQVLCVVK